MDKKELNATIARFYAANEEKKVVESECKDLRADIMEYLEEGEMDSYTTPDGYMAAVTYRKTRKLSQEKVAEMFGGNIPAECYEENLIPVFTVKAAKSAMAVVAGDKPKAAEVAA